ncbi:MAG: rRNA pseudouridine synthase [Planctomycetes bacterium]|nr:rRNA pseudouridine synthase [Planctomycetota bacterium]
MSGRERLHKLLAAGGFGSRRRCEELIRLGEVEVDGRPVTEVGVKVDPERQKIKCAGRYLRPPRPLTLVLNKPRGILCTAKDERGRKTVFDLLHGVRDRLFAVGRLDAESQGLLLLTNDGELCNLLTHPRYAVPRTYHVMVRGSVTPELLERMRKGVWLAEGRTAPVLARVKHRERSRARGESCVLEVTVREGMNREVRRIFSRYGLKVKRLKRIRVGALNLGPLTEGQYRVLDRSEVEGLKRAAQAAVERKETAHAEEE